MKRKRQWYRKSRYGLAVEQWERGILSPLARDISTQVVREGRALSQVELRNGLPPSHAARMPNGLIFHAGGRHRGLRRSPSSDVSIWKHNDVAGIHCQIGAKGDVNCFGSCHDHPELWRMNPFRMNCGRYQSRTCW